MLFFVPIVKQYLGPMLLLLFFCCCFYCYLLMYFPRHIHCAPMVRILIQFYLTIIPMFLFLVQCNIFPFRFLFFSFSHFFFFPFLFLLLFTSYFLHFRKTTVSIYMFFCLCKYCYYCYLYCFCYSCCKSICGIYIVCLTKAIFTNFRFISICCFVWCDLIRFSTQSMTIDFRWCKIELQVWKHYTRIYRHIFLYNQFIHL